MKKIYTLLVAMLTIATMYAVPARPGWLTKIQPDGSTIDVQLMGDEFCHYWINRDGQKVRVDDNGYWQVLEEQLSPAAKAAKRNAAAKKISHQKIAKAPTTGSLRGLVILVNFKDLSFQSGNTQSAMSNMMNADNYTYNGATGSVAKYFADQSNGQYTPVFDVVGPVTLPYSMSHYGANDSEGNDLLPGDMVVEACSIANANHNVDFTQYDNDNDGYVDFVYVIYAGKGEAAGGAANTVWPHAWDLESAEYYSNCSYNESKRKFDSKIVLNYACSSELNYDGSRDGIGTVAHEFSHVIGLPDLYDIDYGKNYEDNMTPGDWHIMDHGSYNNDGKTPPSYTIYDKYFLGWETPVNPGSEAQVLTLTAGKGYQLASSNTLLSATSTNTVYYIENRQKNAWDAALPGHGLLIWKITYNQTAWDENGPNGKAGTIRYALVSATGNTKNIGTAADAFPGTKNKTSWTGLSGKPLKNISESNNVITLTYISDPNENDEGDEGDEVIGSLEGYTKVTNTASLVAGDKVVLYSDDAELGITGWDSNKTATAAETAWVQYVVEAADGGFLLKDGNQYVALTARNSFSYNATGSVCKVTVDGMLCITLSGSDYFLYENANNGSPVCRMYTDKTGDAQYKPFYVYKAVEGGEGGNEGNEGEGGESGDEGEEPTEPQDINVEGLQYCDAIYYIEDIAYYDLDLYKDYDANTGETIYPEIYLSVEAKSKTAINGTYNIVWGGYWMSDEDAVEMDDTKPATISIQHVDNEGNYKVKGSFVGKDGNTYHFDNTVNVLAYDYDNDYADITLNETGDGGDEDDEGETDGEVTGGEVVFVPSEFSTVTDTKFDITKSGVTIENSQGSITSDQFRFFANQTLTISAGSGKITKIEFTCTTSGTAKYGPGCFTASEGNYTYSGTVGTWTGECNSIRFTTSQQVRATKVVVTVASKQTTGTENVTNENKQNYKLMRDGRLIIVRDGVEYDVIGYRL